MAITIIPSGFDIAPGSQPVLVFPLIANRILAAIDLTSTFTGTESGTTADPEGAGTYTGTLSGTDADLGVPTGVGISDPGAGQGLAGYLASAPVAGQLANLAVHVSKDGAAFAVGTGVLSEISAGYYKYVPATTETNNPPASAATSNTGAVVIRISPTNPVAVAGYYIEETMLTLRLKPAGVPSVNLNPGQQAVVSQLLQQPITNLENFIRSAIRDLLGNQLTNKPTFRRDT